MRAGRWAVVFAAVCLVVAVAAVAYAAGKANAVPVQEVVRAERFEVVDGKGVVRAQLAVTREWGGVALALCDHTGKAMAGMSVADRGGTALTLADGQHRPRVQLRVGDGALGLELMDAKTGEVRAGLLVLDDGQPRLSLCDEAGELRASVSVHPDGQPALSLADEKGRTRAVLSLGRGQAGLVLSDDSGRPRAGLSLGRDGQPALGLIDKAGKVVWRAP